MSTARKLDLEQGSPEWLQARYDYVTASQVPVLFDLSPYQTRLGLFEEKILRVETQDISGKEILFERGHNAEKRAREWLKEKGFMYEPVVVVNDACPDLLASLDGISPDGKRMLECKFVGKSELEEIRRTNQALAPHNAQIQTGLYLSQAEVCDYFVTAPDGDSHWLEVVPDLVYQGEIQHAATAFMNCVRSGEPPEPGERDFFQADPSDDRFRRLEELDMALKALGAEFDALKKEVCESFKDHKRVACRSVQIIKCLRKGTIDYKKVPVLKGIDLEKYRKPSSEVVTVRFKRSEK